MYALKLLAGSQSGSQSRSLFVGGDTTLVVVHYVEATWRYKNIFFVTQGSRTIIISKAFALQWGNKGS